MWLADVRIQVVSNIKKTQRWYKENVDEHRKEQPNFKVGTKFGFDDNISK